MKKGIQTMNLFIVELFGHLNMFGVYIIWGMPTG